MITILITMGKKGGRPYKNLFNCLRFIRMHTWIHAHYQYHDYAIAKRIYEFKEEPKLLQIKGWTDNAMALNRFAKIKGWLSSVKLGKMAETTGGKIWLLALAIALMEHQHDAEAMWRYDRAKKDGIIFKPDEFYEILWALTAKLHAVFSHNYIRDGQCSKRDKLTFTGCDYLSHLSLKLSPHHISPRRGIKHLDTLDLAIDVLEMLLSHDPALFNCKPLHFLGEKKSILRIIEAEIINYFREVSSGGPDIAKESTILRNKLSAFKGYYGLSPATDDAQEEQALSLIHIFFFEAYIIKKDNSERFTASSLG